MSRSARFLAAALAGAGCLAAAAPAVAGPRADAEAAYASLDGASYRAVVTSTMRVTARGTGLPPSELPDAATRTVAVQAVESDARQAFTFTTATDELRGVRVVMHDGDVFVSRAGGPYQRAAGALKRYLTASGRLGVEAPRITGAQVLAPVERGGVRLRHLRVRFGAAQFTESVREALRGMGLPAAAVRAAARATRFEPSVADLYVEQGSGRLREVTERFRAGIDLRALARALNAPDAAETRGVIVVQGMTSLRVTALDGVTVERPEAADTVSGLDWLGIEGAPAKAGPPQGDADGIALARRVNAAYKRVPAVVITSRDGRDRSRVVLKLSDGRDRAAYAWTRIDGRVSEWIALRGASFARDGGSGCWTRGPAERFGAPIVVLNGSRFEAPETRGAVVRLKVVERAFGADATTFNVYSIDRRTGRVISLRSSTGVIARYQALRAAPPIAAPARICAAGS